MKDTLMTSCPHCEASFQVAREQLAQAGGRVRCGKCLQIFDGVSGEMEFVAPLLPAADVAHPIEGINVRPMAQSDLPSADSKRPWAGLVILAGLMLLLSAQLYQLQNRGLQAGELELGRLVVRPHPDIDGVLRLDAVLRNRTDNALPFPQLVLGFTSRHGEPRAQRSFLPAEYLHGEHPAAIPARSEIQLSLSLADPGRDAVNYVATLQSVIAPAN
ncbi:MAG: DUF3426 domain-containing protein [Halieaceae bacterium]